MRTSQFEMGVAKTIFVFQTTTLPESVKQSFYSNTKKRANKYILNCKTY